MFSARLKDWEERNTKEKRSTKNESVTDSLQSFDVRTAARHGTVTRTAVRHGTGM